MFIDVAFAAGGAIDNAPTLAEAFLRLLFFILEVFGFLVIIVFVVAGILYLTAAGDAARTELAKKAFLWAMIGTVVGLGAFVLVKALASFLS